MKKLLSLLVLALYVLPSSVFALNFEKIVITYKQKDGLDAQKATAAICQELHTVASSFSSISRVTLQAKGTEVAMEELSLFQKGFSYEQCVSVAYPIVSAYVAFAPLKPAEFIKTSPQPTQLDGTSMATPAVHAIKKGPIRDYIGVYNFQIEIEGINAGK